MLKLFLWLRYLRKKRIVLLSVATVAVSVALLIVVASLFTGFIRAFEGSAVEIIGDVVISAPMRFGKYDKFIEDLKESQIAEAATVILSGQGLLHLPGRGNVRAVSVWGIEPARRAEVTSYKETLIRQKDSPDAPTFDVNGVDDTIGGFVGIAVLSEPDEETDEYDLDYVKSMIGERVVLTTGSLIRRQDAAGGVKFNRRTIPFAISDVMFTGVYDLDRRFIYMPRDALQEALYPDEPGPVADQIQVKIRPGLDEQTAVAAIRGMWKTFVEDELGWGTYSVGLDEVETAREMQKEYAGELRKQMGVLLFIFGIVDATVVLLISCIFYMIVRMKRKDIAIIKSCGATNATVGLLFLGFGAWVGAIGSVLGAGLGYLVTKNINVLEEWIRVVFGLKLWKSSVYMFSKIPNEVDWPAAGQIMAFSVIAAAIGTLIPAIVAVRTRPVKILQYE